MDYDDDPTPEPRNEVHNHVNVVGNEVPNDFVGRLKTENITLRRENEKLREIAEREINMGRLHKAFHDLVVKERDLAEYRLRMAKFELSVAQGESEELRNKVDTLNGELQEAREAYEYRVD